MNFIYKTATQQDIDILVTTRIKVLRAANKLADQVDMSEVAAQSRDLKRRQPYRNTGL